MSFAKSIAVLLIVVAAGQVAVGGGKDDPKLKVAVSAGPIDASGLQTVTVSMTIDKGWHIYANPVKNDAVATAQTRIKVLSSEQVTARVLYPEGKPHTDRFKETYSVYEDRVAIPVQVQRMVGSTAPLEIEVFCMVCNENTCRPTTKKISLP